MMIPRPVLIVAVAGALSLGALLPVGAYWWGYDAGSRAANQDGLFRAVQQIMVKGIVVAALRDTVSTLKRDVAREAARRLPRQMLDSLREARWTSP